MAVGNTINRKTNDCHKSFKIIRLDKVSDKCVSLKLQPQVYIIKEELIDIRIFFFQLTYFYKIQKFNQIQKLLHSVINMNDSATHKKYLVYVFNLTWHQFSIVTDFLNEKSYLKFNEKSLVIFSNDQTTFHQS